MNELYKTEDDVVTITIPDPPDAVYPPMPGSATGSAKFPPPGGSSSPPSGGGDVIIFTGTNSEGQNTVVICNGGEGCLKGIQQPDGTYQLD